VESFTPDPGLFIWTLVTFGLVLFVLARFAFKPLRGILDAREANIRGLLARAEQAAQEAATLRDQGAEQVRQAQDEARRIIDESRRLALTIQEEAEAKAGRDAGQILARTREEIDREVRKSMEDLKETVANLSIRIARQIVRDEIDETRQAALVDDLIAHMKDEHGRP
jgi:F-type H+-transporting ATPase subunit b